MTFSPKVWGDALRRLQEDIPDFVFDAWIAPLAVKIGEDRVILGCPTSFHRDRVRLHYAEPLLRCWHAALREASSDAEARAWSVDLIPMQDFAAASGHSVEHFGIHRAARTTRATHSLAIESRAAMAASPGSSTQALAAGVQPSAASESAPARDGRRDLEKSKGRAGERDAAAGPILHPVPTPGRPRNRKAIAGGDARIAKTKRGPRAEAGSTADPTQPELPFSFESFVVGPCNALAREAALALARARQRSLNMLYLGGESGMGKTHLARAAAIEARRHGRRIEGAGEPGRLDLRGPRADAARNVSGAGVVYTTAEQFTSEFVSAMRNGRSEDWKRRYRGPIGLLIVEDVQHLSGRAKTQLELFHTVQHVLDAGGRVLLTGDRAPRELTGLDARMRDQVGRGFVAELEPPDAIVRRHILRAKASAGGVGLPADCLDLLVESTAGSVRDIESVLIQVVTTSSLLGRPIDLELAREAIDLKSGAGTVLPPRRIEVAEIVRIVAAFFGKRPEALASRSRRRDVLVPRQLAMYLAHRYTDASLGEIGRGLGRDHPSVRNAITRVERLVLENAPMRYQVEALSERVDQRFERSEAGATRETSGGDAVRD